MTKGHIVAVAGRRGRDVRRAAGLRRPSRGLAGFSKGVLRGLVIAGMAGAAWCLGAASAHAAATDDVSTIDLAPMTNSSFSGAAGLSEQAAEPTQAIQPDTAASLAGDFVQAPVSRSNTDTAAHGSAGRGECGATAHASTDTAAAGKEESSKSSRHTRSTDQTGSASTSAVPTSDAPLSLVEDTVEPIGLGGVIAAPAAPLHPYLGLVRPVSEPLTSVARPVVDPLAETVHDSGMGTVTQPVAGVLNGVTTPVAMVVHPVSASLAQVAPIVPGIPGNALGTFVSRLSSSHAGPEQDPVNGRSVTPAQALLHAARYSAEYQPGAGRSDSSAMEKHVQTFSAGTGNHAPFLPGQSPTDPDLGHVNGGALTGGAGSTGHDGGSFAAHQHNLLAGDPRVSRVAPATAFQGLLPSWLSDPAVSPD